MRPIAFAVLSAGLFAVAACSPEAPGGGEATPPADAPPAAAQAPGEPQVTTATDPAAPFRQDFTLLGTEPFWNLQVKGATMVLSQPDPIPTVTGTNTVLTATSGKAVWTAQAGQTPFVATLTAESCSDGMSDRVYPYSAEVKAGDLVLKGCGVSAEDLAKMGRP
ncbi:MAG: hypothetical protein K0R83_2787 [Caulobacter sp.]|jgi:uncharacterized membrane protein|nr:hypothetical protein [Caulobacter sp.]